MEISSRQSKIIVLGVICLFLIFSYSAIIPLGAISGTYIHQNYEHKVGDVPHVADTLVLNKDYTFTSMYFGKGTYEITGTDVTLHYHDKHGGGSFTMSLARTMFIGNIKLMINYDLDQHYKKID